MYGSQTPRRVITAPASRTGLGTKESSRLSQVQPRLQMFDCAAGIRNFGVTKCLVARRHHFRLNTFTPIEWTLDRIQVQRKPVVLASATVFPHIKLFCGWSDVHSSQMPRHCIAAFTVGASASTKESSCASTRECSFLPEAQPRFQIFHYVVGNRNWEVTKCLVARCRLFWLNTFKPIRWTVEQTRVTEKPVVFANAASFPHIKLFCGRSEVGGSQMARHRPAQFPSVKHVWTYWVTFRTGASKRETGCVCKRRSVPRRQISLVAKCLVDKCRRGIWLLVT